MVWGSPGLRVDVITGTYFQWFFPKSFLSNAGSNKSLRSKDLSFTRVILMNSAGLRSLTKEKEFPDRLDSCTDLLHGAQLAAPSWK